MIEKIQRKKAKIFLYFCGSLLAKKGLTVDEKKEQGHIAKVAPTA